MGQKIGAGLSFEDGTLSFIAMAPMISMDWITRVFGMESVFFALDTDSERNPLAKSFSDYFKFSIENFKLAIDMEMNFPPKKDFPQIR